MFFLQELNITVVWLPYLAIVSVICYIIAFASGPGVFSKIYLNISSLLKINMFHISIYTYTISSQYLMFDSNRKVILPLFDFE